ncbi:Bcr/CflA family drug resistance efflux transporter [Paracidovorax avenae]|uniref:multidrug effflux MFS transporter n=1 Tax=Paracidovorax avenae TaxID=80867 RepID=UPI000D1555C1|nr:multidrug effflux MFS transporter [Paracidovorax avenae]AVS91317.1 Bcr/CflA family drug resistance efflux transporter [Paracidovorax avenae]AVT05789.1 Bcr/CflA family drug resistance efflux transporter [Paracidovorax avenae]AVT20035.1 Bcr/CflA family drug resistance efflux transporter [Paracidovorax avenae]
MPSSPFLRMALVLGLLSAIGPFAIDMYLPALPEIGHGLGATVGAVQWSLTAFFLSLGVGQLLYGPLSDMAGRKPPLYFGLVLFTVASIGCALATSIEALLVLRFLQGLGAAAGMVVPRAVVRDLHTGHEAARLMSLLMLVFSVSPLLAPLAGSGVIALAGWRGVFWAVAIAALAGLLLVRFALGETRPAAERTHSTLGSALRGYGLLLRDRHYLGLVFIGGCAMAGFFVYLAGSPFVLINHYGLTPTQYSLAFSFNAAAFFAMAQFNGILAARFGLEPIVKVAATASSAVMAVMLGYYLLGGDRLAVLIGLYFMASALMGLVIPTTSVLALEEHGAIAGTASALMGTLQMLTGAVAMGLVGLFADGRPLPMVAGMATGAFLGTALCWTTLGRTRVAPGRGRRGARA